LGIPTAFFGFKNIFIEGFSCPAVPLSSDLKELDIFSPEAHIILKYNNYKFNI
jgi:hypothetical protein